jgi:hypothetical protein
MKFLLLAMLLSVVQASPPIPRQTPDSSTTASNSSQENSNPKNRPADQRPPAINEQTQPQKHSEPSKQQAQTDTQHSITVSELPPVTINNHRDWADWGTWFFALALTVTSVLQIWLLVRSGKQTERIITQMKDTALRELRAYIGVSEVRLSFQNRWKPQGVVEFKNFGKTPAYNVRQWIGIAPQSYPLTVDLPKSANPLISSVAAIYPSVGNILTTDLKKEFPEGTEIGTSNLTLYVYGKVTYDDVFGNHWYTNYRFIFGGPEKGRFYRSEKGTLCGAMGADSEGNDAD